MGLVFGGGHSLERTRLRPISLLTGKYQGLLPQNYCLTPLHAQYLSLSIQLYENVNREVRHHHQGKVTTRSGIKSV